MLRNGGDKETVVNARGRRRRRPKVGAGGDEESVVSARGWRWRRPNHPTPIWLPAHLGPELPPPCPRPACSLSPAPSIPSLAAASPSQICATTIAPSTCLLISGLLLPETSPPHLRFVPLTLPPYLQPPPPRVKLPPQPASPSPPPPP